MAGFATRAIHAGQPPDPETGAVVTPIHLATTFAQSAVGQHRGFEYGRTGNPTRAALEACLAALEGGRRAFAFASGMAAEATLLLLLAPGDHVVYSEDAYGGTFRLFDRVLRRFGLEFTAVNGTEPEAVLAAFRPNTRLLWLESPTNPLLRLCDLAALAERAHERQVRVCVDNTFASPYLQRPLELGCDFALHSATKYLGGHSDVVGGCVVTADDEGAEGLAFHQNAVGAVPSPFDCFLLLRGIKTLSLRMERQSASAQAVAAWLERHPAVRQVNYPGLDSHPQRELARRQMPRGAGGVVSFDVGDEATALAALGRLRLFTLAESLGAVESLAEHPARMTHGSIPPAERERMGLGPGLIRLSVGLEDVEDLIADLDQALAA